MHMHWWFPYEGYALVSDRPVELHLDELGRMHHPTAMSCSYRDGWGLYSWHGLRIPGSYFESPASPASILAEGNSEIRRALIERHDHIHGKGRFMLDAGAKLIDSKVQPTPQFEGNVALNELLSLDLPGDPEGQMLAVRMVDPSTLREYLVRVHPQLRPLHGDGTLGEPQQLTVQNALASTHGLRGEDYVLQQET
jgi:hypothetical protein